jgi:hypothetical protein
VIQPRISRSWRRTSSSSFCHPSFFSHTADTLAPELDTGLLGQHGGEFATAPLGRDGAVLEGIVIHKAVEVLFESTGHCARSPGTRAIPQALGPLLRQALYPFSQHGIGQVEGLGDGVDMVACHHLTDGLRTAKDPRLLGLLQDDLSGR